MDPQGSAYAPGGSPQATSSSQQSDLTDSAASFQVDGSPDTIAGSSIHCSNTTAVAMRKSWQGLQQLIESMLQQYEDACHQVDTAEQHLAQLHAHKAEVEAEIEQMTIIRESFTGITKLNVGGKLFATSANTLTCQPNSMLAAMFSGRHQLAKDDEGHVFIDRNPVLFEHVLDLLRLGPAWEPPADRELWCRVQKELDYFQLCWEGCTGTVKPSTQPAAVPAAAPPLPAVDSRVWRAALAAARSVNREGYSERAARERARQYAVAGRDRGAPVWRPPLGGNRVGVEGVMPNSSFLIQQLGNVVN